MGNSQLASNTRHYACNEESKNTPPSTNTHPQVTASAASSGATDGRLTKSSGQAGSESPKPLRGLVPPKNRLDNKPLPPIDLASSLTETHRLPQDSQRTEKLEDLEQMYAKLMLKLSEMDGQNKSTPIKSELRGSAFEYKGVMLVVGKGNIAYEQTDAIVNSTGGDFAMNGQISQAIGERAGKDWVSSCKSIGKLNDVYLTVVPNGTMDCNYVMHLRAPSDIAECRKVAIQALQKAIKEKIESISFPMIGGGGMGLENSKVAQALSEVVIVAAEDGKLTGIKLVRFVAFDDNQFDLFVSSITTMIQKASSSPQRLKSAKARVDWPKPSNWIRVREHELCLQIELKRGESEFEKIKTLFEAEKTKEKNNQNALVYFLQNRTLVKIFRLQNPNLYRLYVQTKDNLIKKYHDKPDVLIERTLFHGTSEEAMSKINSQGFNRNFCGKKHKAQYGMGVYFARDLFYSCNPIYSPKNSDKVQSVYVVKALVGVYTQGKQDMEILPEQSSGVNFDSAVDSIDDPAIFVFFRDYETYPEYLMHIKEEIAPSSP